MRNDSGNVFNQQFNSSQSQQNEANAQNMFVQQQAQLLGYGGNQVTLNASGLQDSSAFVGAVRSNPYNQMLNNQSGNQLGFQNFQQSNILSPSSLAQNQNFQQNLLAMQIGSQQQPFSSNQLYNQVQQQTNQYQMQQNYLEMQQQAAQLQNQQFYFQQQQQRQQQEQLYLQQQQQQQNYLQTQQFQQTFQQQPHSSQQSYAQQQPQTTVKQPSPVKQHPQELDKDPVIKEAPMKLAERAAMTAAENQKKMKEREELAEKDRQAHVKQEQEQIEADLKRSKASVTEFSSALQSRLDDIPEPIHLAGCQSLTKVGSLLPVPSECSSTSELVPIVPLHQQTQQITDSTINYLAQLLNASMIELNEVEQKHGDEEINDLNLDEMSGVVMAIHRVDPHALNVDREYSADNVLQFDQGVAKLVDEVTSGNSEEFITQEIQRVNMNQTPSHSEVAVEEPVKGEVAEIKNEQPHDDHHKRKKKDEVVELYDSLTGYFDPSSRRRQHSDTLEDREVGKFFEHSKQKKAKVVEPERPPTPDEIIYQREREWKERMKKRQDKQTRQQNEGEDQSWSHELVSINERIRKFNNFVDIIVDSISMQDSDFTIALPLLDEIRGEAVKLKLAKKMHKIPSDRLTKLLQMLEKIMGDVLTEDGAIILPNEDEGPKDHIENKILKAIEAGCISMIVMTSPKIPKMVLLQDGIEKAIQICKELSQHVIFPAYDPTVTSTDNAVTNKLKKAADSNKKRKEPERSVFVMNLFQRTCEIISCFAELTRFESLNEIIVSNLCTLGTPAFFVDGVGGMQVECIKLLSTIFSINPQLRKSILNDLLENLHRLPSTKNKRNSFRVTETVWISNFTILILQLIQSVVKVNVQRNAEVDDEELKANDIIVDEGLVIRSYEEAQMLTAVFFNGFLAKCTAKAEDDYRRHFEVFLQDVLVSLYRPAYPAAELLLTVLGNLLVKKFRSKTENTLRIACLEYLGTITARLRKDRVQDRGDDKTRLDLVIKTVMSGEQGIPLEDVALAGISTHDKIKKLEQALIDYIITKSSDDVSVEYTILFYVAEWFKETVTDMEAARERQKQSQEQGGDTKKEERKLARLLEKGDTMKLSIIRLVDKKYLKNRAQLVSKNGEVMLDSDAHWTVKYLASKREFSQSFEHFLKQITFGVTNESSVGVRTKAMKCLTQIIEADHKVLLFQDVQTAVNGRLIDTNTSVREATAELIGKYVTSRPDLLEKYYPLIIQRIADTGIAVRKRIIRILRDVIERNPEFNKVPEILAKIIRRVQDEEGIKKLVLETMYGLFFQYEHDIYKFELKLTTIADTVAEMTNANYLEFFKQLVLSVCKEYEDKAPIQDACIQLVDGLVNKILDLDKQMATVDLASAEDIDKETLEQKRIFQRRLTACLSTLSVFANVKPEFLVKHATMFAPYLNMKPTTAMELQVLLSILQMLEKVIPLSEHPGEQILKTLDGKLDDILQSQNNLNVISSTVACAGAIYKKFPKYCPAMMKKFNKYLDYLTMMRDTTNPTVEFTKEKLGLLRRVLFSVGVIARYFDLDAIAVRHDVADLRTTTKGGMRAVVLDVLCHFCIDKNALLKLMALKAFGQLTAQCPEYLMNKEVQKIYSDALKDKKSAVLMQALQNLELFLVSMEEKAIKSNELFQQTKEEAGLKEMEASNSGISSAAIQTYWTLVLQTYFNKADDVRQEAANVIFHTQNQGLLAPAHALPTMIAMCTDRSSAIRCRFDPLVKEFEQKYQSVVAAKAIHGVRKAFHLQDIIRQDKTEIVRGIRAVDSKPAGPDLPNLSNDVTASLNGMYSCLRGVRQTRRAILTQMIKLFTDKIKDRAKLEEWIFIADNLAHFSYLNLDEPLFVIFTAGRASSMAGDHILEAFRKILKSGKKEEDEFNASVIYARMPDDKTKLYELQKESYACYLLLALRNYLIRVYNFKEDKVNEYSPSEAAKVYEKPVTRRNAGIFNPKSILDACKVNPNVEKSIQRDMDLAEHFSTFFNKLILSEDKADVDGDINDPALDEEPMEDDDD